MNRDALPAFWGCFDRFFCISVDQRTDRRDAARHRFGTVGLAGKVEFFIVEKHPTDPERGIYESHLACMERALASGAERTVIFEDDVLFGRFDSRALGDAVAFLQGRDRWDLLFFGCMVRWSRSTAHPCVRAVRYRSLTHAYAVEQGMARRLTAMPWRGVPFDDTLRDLPDARTFAIYPAFAFQDASPSDNERYLPLDRFRRLCGGLHRLQRLNEFHHRHLSAIVAAHAAVILAALLWLLA